MLAPGPSHSWDKTQEGYSHPLSAATFQGGAERLEYGQYNQGEQVWALSVVLDWTQKTGKCSIPHYEPLKFITFK